MQDQKEKLSEATISIARGDFYITRELDDFSCLFPFNGGQRCGLNGFIMILITGGEGDLKVNGKEYRVARGALLAILPFHILESILLSDDFECECLLFRFDFMVDYPLVLKSYISEKIEQRPCIQLKEEEYEGLCDFYFFLWKQYNRLEHPSRVEIVKAILFSLVAEVSFIYSKQTLCGHSIRQEQIVNDFFRLLHAFCKQERRPFFYADKLCMTTKYLSNVLKRVTGHSLYYWISEFSLKEAKILLRSSEMSISRISEELNYPNSSFFARFFKRCTGVSPLQFRNADLDDVVSIIPL